MVFGADPSFVADAVKMAKEERVVDLTASGLVASRRVGNLDVADGVQIGLYRMKPSAFSDTGLRAEILMDTTVLGL